ncbi:VOC family protein [Ureibacillus chungkukjangi]|uniref:Catechol 2,3-dioxygenase n=1 Tax=Ureibacillus chungkukjangi TaxID=1202712 RepID=A0A318TMK0_9BACL|nr:VOC family protein [Ureibacillus chungkukjangi]PYF04238.1 catechol 2,3-dioxygenase [Ureibacillus chungkukjangi]
MPTHFHKKPNMYVSHIQLKVSNLERSLDYYKNIIGFNVLEQTKMSAVLTFDGTTSILSLEEVPAALPLRRGVTGLYHFALLLPTRKDLGNFIQQIIQKNERVGAGDHHVSEAFYLNDPDGNGIEVYSDRPEQDWLWHEDGMVYMTTEQVNVQSVLSDADGKWNGLPAGTVMGHIHLSAANLTDSEKFYTQALGYDIVTRYGNQALFLSTGKYHHHIGLNTWESLNGSPAPENSVGLKSFTIVLSNEAEADKIKENLKSLGARVEAFEGASKFGGAQAFSTLDPSGIRIVFTLDET